MLLTIHLPSLLFFTTHRLIPSLPSFLPSFPPSLPPPSPLPSQACCATSGDGLYEGLDWLSAALQKRK